MEAILVLIVGAVFLTPIALAITAFLRSGETRDETASVKKRVAELEAQLKKLSKTLELLQNPAATAEATSGATAKEMPRPAEATAKVPVEPPRETPRESLRQPSARIDALEAREEKLPPPLPAAAQREEGREFEPAAPARKAKPRPPAVNWEQFLGAKLFAWVGGLALFLGLAFFVKYALDVGWIPFPMRVTLGFVAGIGLLVGGVRMKQKAVEVTAHTLCATGVLVLYACAFACRTRYQGLPPLLGVVPTLLLMTLITTVAFALAVRLNAQVVAVLGILGGFLTPIVVSTGQDNPGGLFTYIALINVGLLAVAYFRPWKYLVPLGALGTVLMQVGWAHKFFERNAYYLPDKLWIPLLVLSGFAALFIAALFFAKRRANLCDEYSFSALGLLAVAWMFVVYFLGFQSIAHRPLTIFGFVFLLDLGLLLIVYLDPRKANALPVGGVSIFLLLAYWTQRWLSPDLLNPALALILIFTVLHSAVPLAFQRLRGITAPAWWSQVFPVFALLLTMGPMLNGSSESFLIWPFVLLVDVIAVLLAVLSATLMPILLVLGLTLIVTAMSLAHIPQSLTGLPMGLTVIGMFAVFFLFASLWALRKVRGNIPAFKVIEGTDQLDVAALMPSFSVALPFLLLIMVSARLPITNPTPIFGLALLLVVLLLGVARLMQVELLPLVGLFATVALEHAWHRGHFSPASPTLPLAWYLVFYFAFTIFPFVFRKALQGQTLPWITAALAGPLHFTLVHWLVKTAYPNPMMGLVPAAFVVPSLIGLIVLVRKVPGEILARNTQLAWFGGVALFFITLIFPIQFHQQWITLGWALEGAALCWLFGRIPHRGLPIVGVSLLVVAFARLAFNPAVLSYHARSDVPIFNWYLYSYGIVIASLFAAAKLLAPPKHIVLGSNVPPILYGLGTVLTFILVNIEIADFFTAAGAAVVTLEFTGNLARDMSYSIAWAVFALTLLIIGIRQHLVQIRYAGIGLLSVTLLKLFILDLSNLGQLYRIGALVAVAVIALLSAFLYQRFLAVESAPSDETPPPAEPLP